MFDVLHWFPVQQHIEKSRLSGLAVPTWPCASLPNRSQSASVGGTEASRSLRSAERGFWWSRLPIQRLCRTAHSLWRALELGMVSLRSCECSLDEANVLI